MLRLDTFSTSVLFNTVRLHEASVHADLCGGLRPPTRNMLPSGQVSDFMVLSNGVVGTVGDFVLVEPGDSASEVLACLLEDGVLYALLRPYDRVRLIDSCNFVWTAAGNLTACEAGALQQCKAWY